MFKFGSLSLSLSPQQLPLKQKPKAKGSYFNRKGQDSAPIIKVAKLKTESEASRWELH